MKIVQVIHSYYPKIGGIESAVQHLAEEQAKLGHEVTVVTAIFGENNVPRYEILNGVKIIRLKSIKLFYNDLIIPIEHLPINADIIHVHSQNSFFSVYIAEKLKKSTSAKIVFHFMAVDSYNSHPNKFLRLFARYYGRRNTKKALELCDLALVRSRRDLEMLKSYGTTAKFLPDAVPDSLLSTPRLNSSVFRNKFAITQTKIFLFIGRIHKLKGPQVLIEALKFLDADYALIFIGPDDGYLKKILNLSERIKVRKQVYILGYVDEATKIAAIDSAIALVNPAIADHVEVYSIVLSEAWAREKPVIASRVGELAFRVKDHVNGLLVEPLNPEMLASAMLKLVNDRPLAEQMGRSGKSEVLSWDEIAKKSITLYKFMKF